MQHIWRWFNVMQASGDSSKPFPAISRLLLGNFSIGIFLNSTKIIVNKVYWVTQSSNPRESIEYECSLRHTQRAYHKQLEQWLKQISKSNNQSSVFHATIWDQHTTQLIHFSLSS
ncbi:hypothetical protein L1049_011682 [Liquidambar formosana]|uniref:Uncharacterized protein n=1 Tax=Liquidambar formosana TaxID=63359 RepID=A0AAP0RRZ4_LIQFO